MSDLCQKEKLSVLTHKTWYCFICSRPPKYFFIKSEMHGRVVDVDRGARDAGTKVCMWKRRDEDNENQLFWEDKYGNIRSKLNDMVLDTTGEKRWSLLLGVDWWFLVMVLLEVLISI